MIMYMWLLLWILIQLLHMTYMFLSYKCTYFDSFIIRMAIQPHALTCVLCYFRINRTGLATIVRILKSDHFCRTSAKSEDFAPLAPLWHKTVDLIFCIQKTFAGAKHNCQNYNYQIKRINYVFFVGYFKTEAE